MEILKLLLYVRVRLVSSSPSWPVCLIENVAIKSEFLMCVITRVSRQRIIKDSPV